MGFKLGAQETGPWLIRLCNQQEMEEYQEVEIYAHFTGIVNTMVLQIPSYPGILLGV